MTNVLTDIQSRFIRVCVYTYKHTHTSMSSFRWVIGQNSIGKNTELFRQYTVYRIEQKETDSNLIRNNESKMRIIVSISTAH